MANYLRNNKLVRCQTLLLLHAQILWLVSCTIPGVTFRTISLPNNTLCHPGVKFHSDSTISCAMDCLVKDNFSDCSAFLFDASLTLESCQCRGAMCYEGVILSSTSLVKVLVNMKCDTSTAGICMYRYYVIHVRTLWLEFMYKIS